MSKVLNYN